MRSLFPLSQAFTEENFRGLRNWAQIFTELKAAKVKTVTVEQVLAAISSRRVRVRLVCVTAHSRRVRVLLSQQYLCLPRLQGAGPLDALLGAPPVLLDVREAVIYDRAHPARADNVPLYKPLMEPKDGFEWARVVAFGALALRPPVRNERFVEEVTALVGGKKARGVAACLRVCASCACLVLS